MSTRPTCQVHRLPMVRVFIGGGRVGLHVCPKCHAEVADRIHEDCPACEATVRYATERATASICWLSPEVS